jgi:hypothetical protein
VETSLIVDFGAVGDPGAIVVTGVLLVSSSKKEIGPPAADDRRRAAVRLVEDLRTDINDNSLVVTEDELFAFTQ